jgi:hypothetical protein
MAMKRWSMSTGTGMTRITSIAIRRTCHLVSRIRIGIDTHQ